MEPTNINSGSEQLKEKAKALSAASKKKVTDQRWKETKFQA